MESEGPQLILRDLYRAFKVDGWEFMLIWARKSYGKTTLLLNILGRFFQWDWDEVFENHLCFTLEQFIDLINRAQERGTKNPVIGWDDAAVYMGKYRWQDPVIQEFSEFFVGIRTYLNALIVTAPKPNLLVKGLREDYTKKVEIIRPIWAEEGVYTDDGIYIPPGKGVFLYQNLVWYDNYYGEGTKTRKIMKEWGVFTPLPEDVYRRYAELRRKYLGEAKLERLLLTLAEKKVPELDEKDIELIKKIGEKGSIWDTTFTSHPDHPLRENYYKLLDLGVLGKIPGTRKVTLTELGERVYNKWLEEREKKTLKSIAKL